MTDIEETSRTTNRISMHEIVMPIYKSLTFGQVSEETGKENSNREHSPFSTYRDLFLLAACYGFCHRRGMRQPLPEGKKNNIRTEVFGDEGLGILKAIAIAETGDVEVLNNMGEVLTIAEEYAYIGVYEIKTQLIDERGQPLWNLVDLLNTMPDLV